MRRALIAGSVLAVVGIGVYLHLRDGASVEATAVRVQSNTGAPAPSNNSVVQESDVDVSAGTSDPVTLSSGQTLTSPDYAAYADWLSDRGYDRRHSTPTQVVGQIMVTQYDNADLDALRSMAAAGDREAQKHLSRRLLSPSVRDIEKPQFDEAVRWLHEASARGYTESLLSLSNAHFQLAHRQSSNHTSRVDRTLIVDSIAYAKVADRRGDLGAKIYVDSLLASESLTPSELEILDQTASKLYDSIAAQRSNLGLGEFDNSVPQSVRTTHEAFLATHSKSLEQGMKDSAAAAAKRREERRNAQAPESN